jgi:hypothetical protein
LASALLKPPFIFLKALGSLFRAATISLLKTAISLLKTTISLLGVAID